MFVYNVCIWVSAVVAVITIGIGILLRYMARNDDYWKERDVPYIPRVNFFKVIKMVFEQPLHELQLKYYKQFDKYWGGFEFSTPVLAVADPDLLRDILVKDFHIFPYRREIKIGDPVTDNMVSVLKGDDWKRVRTIITPAFTSKRMRQMSSIINDCSISVVNSCEKHFKENKPIDCKATFGAFSMDVIASAAFATKINSHDNPQNEFVKTVREVFLEPSFRRLFISMVVPFRLMKYFGLGGSKTMEFFKNVTLQVIKERKQSGKRYNDVLQILMDAVNENAESESSELNVDEEDKFGSINIGISPSIKYKKLSEDELLAQCVLFFFVGYETTASTLTFMAYALALSPEWQDKLIAEVDESFRKHVFVDMTFGAGGHSRQLLNAADIQLYCLDRDPIAYEKAVTFAQNFGGAVTPLLGKFSEMPSVFTKAGLTPNSVDGILIDAGCSSMQMDTSERGFSINKNGPLDMRMDGSRYPDQPTAAEVLYTLDVPSLARIFKVYGEEKHSKKIAQALFDAKYLLTSINTTHELAELIQSTLGSEQRFDKLNRTAHVATKVFQALRIFVNDELNELNYGLELAHTYLKPGGKLAVLTFHSLEDRVAKRQILGIDIDEPVSQTIRQKYKNASIFHSLQDVNKLMQKKWIPLYKHVITPSDAEITLNPRSRSAKLRAAEKISENS